MGERDFFPENKVLPSPEEFHFPFFLSLLPRAVDLFFFSAVQDGN